MKRILIVLLIIMWNALCGFSQAFDSNYLAHIFRDSSDEIVRKVIIDYSKSQLSSHEESIFKYFQSQYYRKAKHLDSAVMVLHDGLEKCEGSHSSIEFEILDELGIILRKLENSKDALEYTNRSILGKKAKGKSNSSIGKSLIIKGNIYYSSFTIQNLDSAKFYFLEAQRVLPKSELRNRAIINNSLSNIYLDEGLVEKGQLYLKRAGNYFAESGDLENSTFVLTNLANCLIESGQIDEAQNLLDSLGVICLNEGLINPLLGIVNNLSIVHEKMGNWEKAIFYKDSLLSLHHIFADEQQQEAEEKYKNNRLQSQLTKERADKLENELELKRNQLWLFILIGLAILLSLLGLMIYRAAQFKQKELSNTIEKNKKEAELQAVRSKMEGEEAERQSIASVLHDHVSGLLSAAAIHLQILKRKADQTSLNKADAIIKDANERIRDISHQLVSPTLLKFGLGPALDSMCENASSSQCKIEFISGSQVGRYNGSVELFVFRAASELLNNTIKHSGATHASITLEYIENNLALSVKDNGEGFDPERQEGLGLASLRSRAIALGGSLSLVSRNGLKVNLSVPV